MNLLKLLIMLIIGNAVAIAFGIYIPNSGLIITLIMLYFALNDKAFMKKAKNIKNEVKQDMKYKSF